MKRKILLCFLMLLILPISFLIAGCGQDVINQGIENHNEGHNINDILIDIIIDGQKYNTITTNSNCDYKISIPAKPEDITTNPNSEKYFYGWFVDSNFQTPLTKETKFTSNGKIYGKWITVYSNNFTYSVNKGEATITKFTNTQNSTVVVVPCYINSFPVKTIASQVFKNQTLLRNVIICNGIKNIESSAFYGCNSMESIELPNTLKNIGNNAFENCEILKSITIPSSVEKIERYAFFNCNLLRTVKFENTNGWWLADNENFVYEKSVDINDNIANNLTKINFNNYWLNYKLHKITYNLDGGKFESNPIYFSEYTNINSFNKASKNFYEFKGYFTDTTFLNPITSINIGTKNYYFSINVSIN